MSVNCVRPFFRAWRTVSTLRPPRPLFPLLTATLPPRARPHKGCAALPPIHHDATNPPPSPLWAGDGPGAEGERARNVKTMGAAAKFTRRAGGPGAWRAEAAAAPEALEKAREGGVGGRLSQRPVDGSFRSVRCGEVAPASAAGMRSLQAARAGVRMAGWGGSEGEARLDSAPPHPASPRGAGRPAGQGCHRLPRHAAGGRSRQGGRQGRKEAEQARAPPQRRNQGGA
jgi:hypothetical protein